LGPVWPVDRAADNVWQPPHPAEAKTFAPDEVEAALLPPHPARTTAAASSVRASFAIPAA
jgi:hypothetical protein